MIIIILIIMVKNALFARSITSIITKQTLLYVTTNFDRNYLQSFNDSLNY